MKTILIISTIALLTSCGGKLDKTPVEVKIVKIHYQDGAWDDFTYYVVEETETRLRRRIIAHPLGEIGDVFYLPKHLID